jgi:glycerol-3-phosphate dehydrogenase
MKRDLIKLASDEYDLLVIGGGIYGFCVARDAILRGLSVCLVEKGDFGHATSFNTLRIIHGGFRYLQSLDILKARQSFREQMVLMKIAPHLVHPLPVFIPAYGHFIHGKEILSLGLKVYDHLVRGVPHDDDEAKIPRGRTVSREECLQTFPDIGRKGLSGGIIFYDCQLSDSERFIISLAQSAAKQGADVANYLEVVGFIKNKNRIRGVRVKDMLTGDEFDLRASFVVSTCGPWLQRILGLIEQSPEKHYGLSKAFNLVVRHKFFNDIAIGIRTRIQNYKTSELLGRRSRYIFITPWKNYSLIGTEHLPTEDSPEELCITEGEVANFIREIYGAYPQVSLGLSDVDFIYKGCLPTILTNRGSVRLASKYRIYDHGRENGLEGIISVSGVKFTEARYVAEKVVDLVFAKLNRKSRKSQSSVTPAYGGEIERLNDFILGEIRRKIFGLSPIDVQNLISSYGSAYTEVLENSDKLGELGLVSSGEFIRKAKILQAIREEMAHNLSDVLFRRTDLGMNGRVDNEYLTNCAEIMAQELNWSSGKIKEEVGEVTTLLSSLNLNG